MVFSENLDVLLKWKHLTFFFNLNMSFQISSWINEDYFLRLFFSDSGIWMYGYFKYINKSLCYADSVGTYVNPQGEIFFSLLKSSFPCSAEILSLCATDWTTLGSDDPHLSQFFMAL